MMHVVESKLTLNMSAVGVGMGVAAYVVKSLNLEWHLNNIVRFLRIYHCIFYEMDAFHIVITCVKYLYHYSYDPYIMDFSGQLPL